MQGFFCLVFVWKLPIMTTPLSFLVFSDKLSLSLLDLFKLSKQTTSAVSYVTWPLFTQENCLPLKLRIHIYVSVDKTNPNS